jgi:hypothetical protein
LSNSGSNSGNNGLNRGLREWSIVRHSSVFAKEMVSNKALSSGASTSCNTPLSRTNKWPVDKVTFRSAK